MDDGHEYLDPRNPAVGNDSRDRVREEEVQQEILERLTWIPGVQVWVELVERATPSRRRFRVAVQSEPGWCRSGRRCSGSISLSNSTSRAAVPATRRGRPSADPDPGGAGRAGES